MQERRQQAGGSGGTAVGTVAAGEGRAPGLAADGAAVAAAVVVGGVVGGLTSVAQGVLPQAVASLANSSAPWVVVAFLVALVARRLPVAIVVGGVTLVCLLVGYVAASALRGFPSSSGLLVFWGAAAVTAGPLVGLGAHWVRWKRGVLPALGVGGFSGMLVGEGVNGMLHLTESTSTAYWWGEVVVGVLVLAAAAWLRLRSWRSTVVAAVVAVVVAVAFELLYSRAGLLIGIL